MSMIYVLNKIFALLLIEIYFQSTIRFDKKKHVRIQLCQFSIWLTFLLVLRKQVRVVAKISLLPNCYKQRSIYRNTCFRGCLTAISSLEICVRLKKSINYCGGRNQYQLKNSIKTNVGQKFEY